MWRIWGAPNNASKGEIGFNSAFKGLITLQTLKLEVIRNYFAMTHGP
jgi:hypothetical protein